jgi:hypothetical protein
MKIFVVYYLLNKDDRSTIGEHLYAFKRYSNEKCFYLNTAYGIPRFINKLNFDLIVFHYTFLHNFRGWNGANWYKPIKICENLKGYKIAIPQDEYQNTVFLNQLFLRFKIKAVFTCLPESEWQKVYPRTESGLEHYFTVFPGYIDENALKNLGKLIRRHELISQRVRPIDIGYRARKVPYWVGKHGLIKWQLTEKLLNTPIKHSLKLDLSNDPKSFFYGDEWYKFLARCRVVLGCESGASLHDPTGSIMTKVDQYILKHPKAGFEEVESACFPGLDGNLKLFALSPRHFEACITRTCQALVEGEYGGIFKPGIHYIEIKKDWSNIVEVIRKIEDVDYCEKIADNAYQDIVKSGLYSYRQFVDFILSHVRSVNKIDSENSSDNSFYSELLVLRERFPFIFSPIRYSVAYIKYVVYRLLVKLNLYEKYKEIKAKY